MFAAELTKIKESEAKADELQKKAKADYKRALEDARAKAEQIVEDARSRARTVYDSLLAEGQKISDEQYDLFLAETRKSCQAMSARARENESKAVDMIAERIVRASVNR